MNKKRMASLTALTITLLLVLGNVGYAHAANSPSEGTINVVTECTITSPELWNAGWSVDENETQLTVNTEYRVNFTVSDKDGMDQISYCYVKIWDTSTSSENGTDAENDHYTFKWNSVTGSWSCIGPASGFYKGGSGSNSSSINQYEFYVAFDLSKVALYSNTGPTYIGWKITINATDGTNPDTLTQCLGFGVAEYSECANLSSTHSWTSVQVPSTDNILSSPGASLTFTAIINRAYNVTAKSNATTAHDPTYGYTLGIGNVTQNSVNTAGTSTALSTSEVIIGKDGASPLDAKAVPSSESGDALNCYLWVDIPEGQPPGAYIYTLTITVQADS